MQIILHGWVLTEQGQEEKRIRRMNEGLAIWGETRVELFLPSSQARLAEASERWWEAELYRLKGELLLKSCVKRERKPL